MRFPEFLKEHGTIGFVAPSFGCATEPYYTAFAHARERFGQMGYHTQTGPNCLVDKGIGISNDPALCGKELNESYCGTENDVLITPLICIYGTTISVKKPVNFTHFSNYFTRLLHLKNPE
jgi:muramoyltetrapeptide carboxypeptidase